MLELRPSCENCNTALPPSSLDAMICAYECTFCKKCVEEVLENVCPNCGGGFCQRPNRPNRNLRNDNYLGKDPPSSTVKYRPVDIQSHKAFAENIKSIPPHKR